jgi:hypothetical protein
MGVPAFIGRNLPFVRDRSPMSIPRPAFDLIDHLLCLRKAWMYLEEHTEYPPGLRLDVPVAALRVA